MHRGGGRAPARSGPVKTRRAQHDCSEGIRAVATIDPALGAKSVERRQLACWGDFEKRACAIGVATRERSPVEVSAGFLNQPGPRILTVLAVCFSAKAVERRELARRGDFKNRATSITRDAVRSAAENVVP